MSQPFLRQATADDVPLLLELVAAFQAEVLPDLAVHRPTCAASLTALIRSDHGYVGLLDAGAPRGLLLAQASASAWAPVLVAEEALWWIAPGWRGRWARAMLDDFEGWAARIGARATGLSHTGKSADALYRRRGYRRAETKYLRVT